MLSAVVMLPDYIFGFFGINMIDLPNWIKVINVIYILAATIIILYRYGLKTRAAKDPDGTKGYPYGTAFSAMMSVVVVTSIPVALLTFLLRNYICTSATSAASFFGIWSSSLILMLILGGMSALFSSVYVKKLPVQNESHTTL